MAGSLHSLLLLETRHAVCELIKLCVLSMGAVQLPGVLLRYDSVTEGILICQCHELAANASES